MCMKRYSYLQKGTYLFDLLLECISNSHGLFSIKLADGPVKNFYLLMGIMIFTSVFI